MDTKENKSNMELVLKELAKGLKVIEKLKKEAKFRGIETYTIASDENLEDIAFSIDDSPEDKKIDPDELRKDMKSRAIELHMAMKADMTALRSIRSALGKI